MAVSKRVGRALWAVVVLGGLAGVLAALGWGLMTGMERAANELPAVAAETTEGDGLSAFALARWTGSESARARLLGEAVDAAATDWRVLALIEKGHPVDLPLSTGEVRRRLHVLAGDNAYVHLARMETIVHCCRHHDEIRGGCCASDLAEAAAAGEAATHYESPGPALRRSLVRRFDQVPARRFGWVLPETAKSAAVELNLSLMTMSISLAPLSELDEACADAHPGTRIACSHLAWLVIRDSDSMFDQEHATELLAAVGTPAQRAAAAERERELAWLRWNRRQIGETISFGDQDEAYAAADTLEGMTSLAAARTLLQSRGVAPLPPKGWVEPTTAPPED